jgi:hypothetical protein
MEAPEGESAEARRARLRALREAAGAAAGATAGDAPPALSGQSRTLANPLADEDAHARPSTATVAMSGPSFYRCVRCC